MRHEITLALKPAATPRAKVAKRGNFAHAYYPSNYKRWKEKATAFVLEATKELKQVIAQPVLVESLELVIEPPKTTKLPFPKPDIDNFLKAVLDALVWGKVLADDWWVYRIDTIEKRWANPGEESHIKVVLVTDD